MGQRLTTSAEFKLFGALSLLVGIIVVATVAYDIYLHPADPETVGTATIEISGTTHFRGDVGTVANMHTIEGNGPATVEVPYRRADYVVADIEQDSGTVEICAYLVVGRKPSGEVRAECTTVEEGTGTLLMWKVPRQVPPKALVC